MANRGSSSVGLVDASISSLSGSSELLIAENNTKTVIGTAAQPVTASWGA